MSSASTAGHYRLFSFLALLAGFVAVGVAWRANRNLEAHLGAVDLSRIAEKRDVQYGFTVDAYGYRYKGVSGNVGDEQVLMFGLYEKDRLYFMRDYLKAANVAGAVAIDGGANTGNHSLFLSRLVAEVHAFEPFPPVIARFRENLALNPEIRNVELYEVGLGEKEAELAFVQGPPEEMGGGSFQARRADLPGYTVREQKLKVVAADAWMENRLGGPLALVKLDVEGHEEAVLKGMRNLLERHRPLLVVEVGDLPEGTIVSIEQLAALFPADYEFLAFDNLLDAAIDGRYRLVPLTKAVFESPLRRKLDVVAYPRERAALVPR
jgi:FkbM family methyltransferase